MHAWTLSGFKFDSLRCLKFRHDDNRLYLQGTAFDHAHKNTQNFHFRRGTLKARHASYVLSSAAGTTPSASIRRASGMAF
jgi:hypothetical protein